MTPSARLAAAIDIIDQVLSARGPADEVLKAWARRHRFAGAKDRKALAEIVYAAFRARARSSWALEAEDGRALVLGALRWSEALGLDEIAALFSGDGYAPSALTDQEQRRLVGSTCAAPAWVDAGVPAWIAEGLEARFGAVWRDEARAAILPRAPVDLRVNTLRGDVEGALRLLAHEEVHPERTPLSSLGLRLPPAFARDVQGLRAFTSGWIEVQDEGSQVIAALACGRPGETVIDYCAGGGGKTLALGAAMANQGRLIASDVNGRRLQAMGERLGRAGVKAEVRRLGADGQGMDDLDGRADLVFVDAPCSGSGTWRRHPEAAWRLTPESIDRLAALQGAILDRAAKLVRPRGRLIYVTCSLLDAENERVAARFALAHPEFQPSPVAAAVETPSLTKAAQARLCALAGGGHTVQLTPNSTGTDGFFAALFQRVP